jgi:hypothetical protein
MKRILHAEEPWLFRNGALVLPPLSSSTSCALVVDSLRIICRYDRAKYLGSYEEDSDRRRVGGARVCQFERMLVKVGRREGQNMAVADLQRSCEWEGRGRAEPQSPCF